jgi:hypothetical protein
MRRSCITRAKIEKLIVLIVHHFRLLAKSWAVPVINYITLHYIPTSSWRQRCTEALLVRS